MSYCRWSTDNFRCDIYAYESCMGGWEIHVASHRYNEPIPEVDYDLLWGSQQNIKKFVRQRRKQSKYFKKCGSTEIGLTYDGESFNAGTLEEFRDIMIMLRNEGYRFPDYVFSDIKEEMDVLLK